MSITSQRMDIHDPEVVKTFAKSVGSITKLDALYASQLQISKQPMTIYGMTGKQAYLPTSILQREKRSEMV